MLDIGVFGKRLATERSLELQVTAAYAMLPHVLASLSSWEAPTLILFVLQAASSTCSIQKSTIMAVNPSNKLSAASLTQLMTRSLPKTSEDQIRNSYDAVALLMHACMLAVGFRLVGLGEDHRIGMRWHSLIRRD